MFYSFVCPKCGSDIEEMRPMADACKPGPICICGSPTQRVFDATIIGDEIKSSTYFHPDKRANVRDHGRIFDIGMGKWIESKSQRRALIKQKGLMEHGSGTREV